MGSAFKDPWKWGQRCLVITNGFYEWKKLDPKGKFKQAYAIQLLKPRRAITMTRCGSVAPCAISASLKR